MACFSAAGAVFDATGGQWNIYYFHKNFITCLHVIFCTGASIMASPALVACNSAYGTCEAACVAALLAPTL